MRALVLGANLQVPLPAFFALWGDDIVSVVFLTSLLLALHFVYCIDSQIDEWLFVCLYKQRHSYFLCSYTLFTNGSRIICMFRRFHSYFLCSYTLFTNAKLWHILQDGSLLSFLFL